MRERALNDGASDYLIKSGPLDKLVECIRRAKDPEKTGYKFRRPSRVTTTVATEQSGGFATHPLKRGLEFFRAFWN
jgi:DNA-binding NarL/FixJ family response regulator